MSRIFLRRISVESTRSAAMQIPATSANVLQVPIDLPVYKEQLTLLIRSWTLERDRYFGCIFPSKRFILACKNESFKIKISTIVFTALVTIFYLGYTRNTVFEFRLSTETTPWIGFSGNASISCEATEVRTLCKTNFDCTNNAKCENGQCVCRPGFSPKGNKDPQMLLIRSAQ